MTNANQELEAWLRHEKCLALEDGPRIAFDPVAFSKTANAQHSFYDLGRLLHRMEMQIREIVDGDWHEQLCEYRAWSPEVHPFALEVAELLAQKKTVLFQMAGQLKEKLREEVRPD